MEKLREYSEMATVKYKENTTIILHHTRKRYVNMVNEVLISSFEIQREGRGSALKEIVTRCLSAEVETVLYGTSPWQSLAFSTVLTNIKNINTLLADM